MSLVIPDKTYFKIGEVAKILGVKPYILRYWESEFRALRPQKSRSRHRLYRRRDVEILVKIRHLLYDEKFTIAGAKQRISELMKEGRFVPGKSGLVLTESEAESVSEDGVSFGDANGDAELQSGVSSTDESEVSTGESGSTQRGDADADELVALRLALSEARGNLAAIKAERDEFSAQSTERGQALTGLRAELESLKNDLDAARIEAREAQAELAAATEAATQAGDGDLEVRTALAGAQRDLVELRAALNALSTERDGLVATRERLRDKIRDRRQQDEIQADQLEDAHNTIQALQGANADLELRNEQLQHVAREAQQARESLLSEMGDVAAVHKELDALRVAESTLRERFELLQRAHEETSETAVRLQQHLDTVALEHKVTVGTLEDALASANARISTLARENESLSHSHSESLEFGARVEQLSDQKSALEHMLESSTQRRHVLSRDLRRQLLELNQVLEKY